MLGVAESVSPLTGLAQGDWHSRSECSLRLETDTQGPWNMTGSGTPPRGRAQGKEGSGGQQGSTCPHTQHGRDCKGLRCHFYFEVQLTTYDEPFCKCTSSHSARSPCCANTVSSTFHSICIPSRRPQTH